MANDEALKTELQTLDFYERSIARKIAPMSGAERYAFLADLFGRRSTDIYNRLLSIFPELLA